MRIFLLKNRSASRRRAAEALSREVSSFRPTVWRHYRRYGRHDLPWRNLPAGRQGRRDPYKILVSEVMLQQTQVERVIPFYKAFIKQFPTPRALAEASLADVLRAWQGLGYNRRARLLRESAKAAVAQGGFPKTAEELEKMPGIGPYTARAVAAFAYNQDGIVIETNIRTAIIHHFFPKKKKVSDTEIEQVLRKVLPKGRAREWYSALMDYGAHLKRNGISHNTKSETYTKQSVFRGSLREARGAILRALTEKPLPRRTIEGLCGAERKSQVRAALQALLAEHLIERHETHYTLAR